MFKGLGAIMDPFNFSFSDGVVTGPNYSFDLRAPLAAESEPGRDFYRASPGMLIHYVYEDWNKKFNPTCIKSGGNLYLGVTWDSGCIQASGTANLLTNAGLAILPQIEAWGRAFLGPPTTGGGSGSGGSTGGGSGSGSGSTPPSNTLPPSGGNGEESAFAITSTMLWIGGAAFLALLFFKR